MSSTIDVRHEIRAAMRGLRDVFERLPHLGPVDRVRALDKGREHEARLRRLLTRVNLTDRQRLEIEARLLWCRVHLVLMCRPSEVAADTTPALQAAALQTGGLNALAGLAVVLATTLPRTRP